MNTALALAILACADCKTGFMACPDCVNTVRIDPETGFPPDTQLVDGRLKHLANPDPEATGRSIKQPVCDVCVAFRNEEKRRGTPGTEHIERIEMLWAERHRNNHV